jgi:hypothetical protein
MGKDSDLGIGNYEPPPKKRRDNVESEVNDNDQLVSSEVNRQSRKRKHSYSEQEIDKTQDLEDTDIDENLWIVNNGQNT